MRQLLGLILLSASFTTSAIAQTAPNQSPAANAEAAATIKPGVYTGRVIAESGRSRAADVKITLRSITTDGRVTARVSTSPGRKSCAKPLPLNGLVLPDGNMRLTVDDGAPTGCQRIYHVKLMPDGSVSGTFIDG